MCFSAEASFAAAAVLVPAGAYCVRVAARVRSAYLPLAAIPLFFAAQQFCEGLVWVGLARGDDSLVRASALAFLAFALAFWPFWVPFSVVFVERRKAVRRCLAGAALLGLALGCGLFVPLALRADEWLSVYVEHHSVRYNPGGLPAFSLAGHTWWDAGYGALVFVPLLAASSDRRFAAFFLVMATAAGLSLLAFRHAFVSVWCFFAAVLSAQLCHIFSGLGRAESGANLAGVAVNQGQGGP